MKIKESCWYDKQKGALRIHRYMLSLFLGSISLLFLFGCGSDRVNIEFQSSREIYIDDAKTDPDKLNRELEYDLKEAEKQRLQKQRAAEAAAKEKAKAEAERKGEPQQDEQEPKETIQAIRTEPSISQP
ncbi:MAG: hypothetical protein CV087_02115 [Candidatus Brocadia sp. WS118]|nr:MAG: hypothetical protein CV087_02115 [Candidatus Brocadia sp. WS118]